MYASRSWRDVEVFDRVGSGDAFAAGFLFGLMGEVPLNDAIEIAVASSILAMASPGDSLDVTRAEIQALVSSLGAAPVR